MAEPEPESLITTNGGVDESSEYRTSKNNRNSNHNNNNNNNDNIIREPPQKRRRSSQTGEPVQLSPEERRVLRMHYKVLKDIINGKNEDLCKGDHPERFHKIIEEVNRLNGHVTNPREQVTDAETLLEMASILLATVKSYSTGGATPSDFIRSLIRDFGVFSGRRDENEGVSIKWKDLGMHVCPIFKKAQGCPTMLGPMDTQLRQRKTYARKRRTKLTGIAAKPEEVEDSSAEDKKDTDKNMATMFNILRTEKRVKLENLILNRFSFAQTVENLFALSFLVKDGRAQVVVDDKGTHVVSPRNAPASNLVTSGEVSYHHFVFRLDFKDWKLMSDSVVSGEELMPHRYQVSIPLSQEDAVPNLTQVAIPTSPLQNTTTKL